MPFSCLRLRPHAQKHQEELQLEAPRPVKRNFRRAGTSQSFSSSKSRASVTSNSSIATLPPCPGVGDPKIEAMMMSVPHEQPRSKPLRLSQPRIYGGIVDSMKQCKGCRDWRSFDVFYDDEIDMSKSANWEAEKRAADTARKIQKYERTSSSVADLEAFRSSCSGSS